MSRPRISLVVNPAANRGTAGSLAGRVADRLSRAADVRLLTGASEAESISLLARAGRDADAVIVCGGDGIAHLAANALAGGDVPLGIVPAGSGNDTAAALGVPADPVRAADALLAALRAGSVARIDLGHCETGVEDGDLGVQHADLGVQHADLGVAHGDFGSERGGTDGTGRWWLTMCYGGFDSGVNERANRMRWPTGPRRYDVAIGLELLRLRPRRVRLCFDDGELLELSVTLVAIGNGPQYGGGKLMTPDAKMDDGILDVTVVGPVSRLTLARLAPTLPRAGHLGHPAVTRYRAKEILFAGADPDDRVIAYADGERVAGLPLRIRCVPAALPVLVPTAGPAPGLSR